MANLFEQGVVREQANVQLGRGNNALNLPLTRCSDSLQNGYWIPALWKLTEVLEGAKHIRAYIEHCIRMGIEMEFGPLPGCAFWGPNAILGSVLPANFTAGGVVIGAQLNAYPHTFVRKERSKFINLVDSSFHLGLSAPYSSVADFQAKHGTDADGENNEMAWGWHCVTYGEETGSEHSCWFFWKDSELFSAIIEHRRLNKDGTESEIAPEWSPKQIWQNIIKPRIDKNMPIKRFGIISTEDGQGGWIFSFAEAGQISETQYIQAASYIFPIEPLVDVTNLATWTASKSDYTDITYVQFRLFPGWNVPNVALLMRVLIDGAIDPIDFLRSAQASNTANCLLNMQAMADEVEWMRRLLSIPRE